MDPVDGLLALNLALAVSPRRAFISGVHFGGSQSRRAARCWTFAHTIESIGGYAARRTLEHLPRRFPLNCNCKQ